MVEARVTRVFRHRFVLYENDRKTFLVRGLQRTMWCQIQQYDRFIEKCMEIYSQFFEAEWRKQEFPVCEWIGCSLKAGMRAAKAESSWRTAIYYWKIPRKANVKFSGRQSSSCCCWIWSCDQLSSKELKFSESRIRILSAWAAFSSLCELRQR